LKYLAIVKSFIQHFSFKIMKKMIKDFLEFFKVYKVIVLAIAFVIGVASTSLIKSLVDNVIMPVDNSFY